MKNDRQKRALRKAFEDNNINIAALARKMKIRPMSLYHVKQGVKEPGPIRAIAIENATGGKVPRHILRPDLFGGC